MLYKIWVMVFPKTFAKGPTELSSPLPCLSPPNIKCYLVSSCLRTGRYWTPFSLYHRWTEDLRETAAKVTVKRQDINPCICHTLRPLSQDRKTEVNPPAILDRVGAILAFLGGCTPYTSAGCGMRQCLVVVSTAWQQAWVVITWWILPTLGEGLFLF